MKIVILFRSDLDAAMSKFDFILSKVSSLFVQAWLDDNQLDILTSNNIAYKIIS